MGFTVNTDLLRKNLAEAVQCPSPAEQGLADPPPELSGALQYLIRHVLNPLSSGERVHSSELDFSRFSDSDLADLYDYYLDHCYDGTSEWYKLKAIYTACRNAKSQAVAVCFL